MFGLVAIQDDFGEHKTRYKSNRGSCVCFVCKCRGIFEIMKIMAFQHKLFIGAAFLVTIHAYVLKTQPNPSPLCTR